MYNERLNAALKAVGFPLFGTFQREMQVNIRLVQTLSKYVTLDTLVIQFTKMSNCSEPKGYSVDILDLPR